MCDVCFTYWLLTLVMFAVGVALLCAVWHMTSSVVMYTFSIFVASKRHERQTLIVYAEASTHQPP